jgi:hypothetical protein
MKAVGQFPVMVGFRLSGKDAAKLAALAQQTGLTKSVVVRELVRQVRVEAFAPPACPDAEEIAATPT